MACMLIKGVDENDNCSKKSSKILKRICETNLWNERLIHITKS